MTNRMIRILYIIGQLEPNGAEWQLVRLLDGLDKASFRCYVCSLWPVLDLAPEIERAGAIMVPIFKRRRFDASVSFRLARFIRKEKIDIVHCFLPTANAWGRLGGILAGTKVVVSERNVESWKPWYWLWLDRLLARYTSIILTNAEAIKRFVVSSTKIEPDRVRVIYNSVNSARFSSADSIALRSKLRIMPEMRVITSIGRLEEQKDFPTFLAACAMVREWVSPLPIRILVVGQGSLREELERQAQTLGLTGETVFLGWRKDIETVLALTDVFVLTSIREGLPNVVLEAMAAGKPVVASRVGGTPEAVVDGVTGLLISPRDAPRCAEAICRLLNNPTEATAMGARGQAHVLGMFTQARMVRETEQIYFRLQRGLSGDRNIPIDTVSQIPR